MIGDNIKKMREFKQLDAKDLANQVGITPAYLSLIENNKRKNPTMDVLNKIADALEVSVNTLLEDENLHVYDKKSDKNIDLANEVRESQTIYGIGEFKFAEDAIKFILEQPAIMGYGGFDIHKMSSEEIIEFANELLRQLKLISYKYKK